MPVLFSRFLTSSGIVRPVRVSDSGARGRGFGTYLRCVVSLSKDTYTPRKGTGNTQEAAALSRHDYKIVDWDVKHQHKQTKQIIRPVQLQKRARCWKFWI